MKLPDISWPQSGYRSPWLTYKAVYALLGVVAVLCLLAWPCGVEMADTRTYVSAFENLRHFKIDNMRPPLYPCILGLAGLFAGGKVGLFLLVVFQWLLYGVAVECFRRTAMMLMGRQRPVFWATVFFALMPGIWEWNYVLQSESMSISLCVVLAWLMVRVALRPKASGMLYVALLVMLLVMLRSIFAVLIPVLVCFVALLWLRFRPDRRMIAFYGLGCVSVVVMLFGAYWAEVHNTYGLKSVSAVNTYNNYLVARMAGIIQPGTAADPRLDGMIRQYVDTGRYIDMDVDFMREAAWLEVNTMVDSLGHPVVEEYVGRRIASSPKAMLKYYLTKFQRQLPDYSIARVLPYRWLNHYGVHAMMPVNMALAAYIMAALLFFMLRQSFRRRSVAAGSLALWLLCMSVYMAAILGAMDDYTRLFAPVYPVFVLLVFQSLSMLRRRSDAAYI